MNVSYPNILFALILFLLLFLSFFLLVQEKGKRISNVLSGGFFIGIFVMLSSSQVLAQSTAGVDYFAGKWNVLVKGLPDGDTKMLFVLEKKDSTLTGVVQDSSGNLITKIDRVEIGANTAALYFIAQGYDVNLVMNKKDDDHITGSLMGMFDAEGDRVKPTK